MRPPFEAASSRFERGSHQLNPSVEKCSGNYQCQQEIYAISVSARFKMYRHLGGALAWKHHPRCGIRFPGPRVSADPRTTCAPDCWIARLRLPQKPREVFVLPAFRFAVERELPFALAKRFRVHAAAA